MSEHEGHPVDWDTIQGGFPPHARCSWESVQIVSPEDERMSGVIRFSLTFLELLPDIHLL